MDPELIKVLEKLKINSFRLGFGASVGSFMGDAFIALVVLAILFVGFWIAAASLH